MKFTKLINIALFLTILLIPCTNANENKSIKIAVYNSLSSDIALVDLVTSKKHIVKSDTSELIFLDKIEIVEVEQEINKDTEEPLNSVTESSSTHVFKVQYLSPEDWKDITTCQKFEVTKDSLIQIFPSNNDTECLIMNYDHTGDTK